MEYKYKVLANTTLGGLLSSLNATILLISLPAIFRGIKLNPFAPGSITLLLWIILSYMIVTASLLVFFGKLSDIHGRRKLYIIGFVIFTVASIILSLTPNNSGIFGAYFIIINRIVQAIGGGLIMVNSTALLSDAFPANERGKALGINQVSFTVGNFLGIILGGLFSTYDFHLVFLVSVPFGIAGTIWAFTQLKEEHYIKEKEITDNLGNILLATFLISFSIALSYALIPYNNSQLGWSNPIVISLLAIASISFILFILREIKTKKPFLNFKLFKIRSFSFSIAALLFNSLATGALMFLVIIWLQAIYLPLKGYSYQSTPFWSGIYMLPLLIFMSIFGPIGGAFTDKYGARAIATLGMIIMGIGFILLSTLPADFNLNYFIIYLSVIGIGTGLFAAPNTTAIMNSLPIAQKGEGNGVRQTIGNVSRVISLTMFFTIAVSAFVISLPKQMDLTLSNFNVSQPIITELSKIPGSDLLFASLLGYSPISYLPKALLQYLPSKAINFIQSTEFLPSILSQPFTNAIKIVFIISMIFIFIGAVFSAFRGKMFINKKREV